MVNYGNEKVTLYCSDIWDLAYNPPIWSTILFIVKTSNVVLFVHKIETQLVAKEYTLFDVDYIDTFSPIFKIGLI